MNRVWRVQQGGGGYGPWLFTLSLGKGGFEGTRRGAANFTGVVP